MVNWVYVSYYWTILADLGQITPTTYPRDDMNNLIWTQPTVYPPTNNIFINPESFEIYYSYLKNTIFPILNIPPLDLSPPPDSMITQPPDVTFVKSYSCIERRLKAPISLIISVIVADYTFVVGLYTLVILIAGIIQKRRKPSGKILIIRF